LNILFFQGNDHIDGGWDFDTIMSDGEAITMDLNQKKYKFG
jgi:hypothetical protein